MNDDHDNNRPQPLWVSGFGNKRGWDRDWNKTFAHSRTKLEVLQGWVIRRAAVADPPSSARQPGKWPVESVVEMIEGMSLQERRNAAASDVRWRVGIYGTSAASVSETYYK